MARKLIPLIPLKESYFSLLPGDEIRVCKIGDEVSPMWGMNCVLLSRDQIAGLLNGDCIWLTEGEYATVLRAAPAEEGET